MKTYQDLLKVGEDERAKGEFCYEAVNEFIGSKEYQDAATGEAYYAKHNITIEKYQKFLTTLSGRQVPDIFSSNYKLKTLFFRRLVTQQVQYVLGNGLNLSEDGDKDKLGTDFDFKLQTAAKKAMVAGRSFGFWNADHLEVFGYADTPNDAGFCPFYDEETGQLKAGVRFWFRTVGNTSLFRATLYEVDGYTDFVKQNSEDVEVTESKRSYKTITSVTPTGVVENTRDENYSELPIIPMYASDTRESELVGIRESIDCYDFIKSGLANDIDDTSGFYWVLKNTGGMEDTDLARFVQRMKQVKAANIDGDEGVSAEAHTLDVPVQARQTMIEILRKDIYEDFQALDVNTLSAAAKTTQEIQASYQAQDNKCADFEYYILDFVQKILNLAGISSTPTFVWNKVVNQAEQTQMVLSAANYLTDDVIIKHLPFLTPEEAEEVLAGRDDEDLGQFEDEDMDEDMEEEGDNSDLEEINSLLDELLEGLGDE